MLYICQDIDELQDWIDAGIAALETLLAKYAKFTELYGV